ncbi:MAG: hypothetical protein KC502_11360 [Myxococcales bacterium]|nr:hypothetical protein [Myxococcales bacterium]
MSDTAGTPLRNIELSVRTGTHLLAGTDAPVWVQLVGSRRRTQWFLLQPEGGDFERASIQTFSLAVAPAVDPGEVEVVNVQIGEGGALGGWYLDSIHVDGAPHRFDAWLALDEPPFRLDASSVRDDAARAYDIVVQTSEAFLSGTDAPVFLQIIGTKTSTPWIRLHEPEKRSFRAGSMDHFREWSEDVGVIVGAWLKHHNEGLAPGWRVEWVDIDGRRLAFDRWLAMDEGNGRLDAYARHRPWLKADRPLQLSLTTFADIRERAEAALSDDIMHANRAYGRYGITIERAPAERDVILDTEQWITFQARHADTAGLAKELVRLRSERAPQTHRRVLPVFYVGGFEHMTGRYPGVSRPPWGVFLSLAQRRPTTLCYELGRYFGLQPTSGASADPALMGAPRVHANPHDVMEGEPSNLMAGSKLPINLLRLTNGQLESMVLGLMRFVT